MSPVGWRMGLGLALIALAALIAPPRTDEMPRSDGTNREASVSRPLAEALRPLGPAKAILSAGLWMLLQREQGLGGQDASAVAEGLLALHPGLERVREFLAHQLIVTLAPRAPDDERHAALVVQGLGMLEEGLRLSDSPGLHAALGRLLALQPASDARFADAARRYFGADPEWIAVGELRSAPRGSLESRLLIELLLLRALRGLDADLVAAERDLREVEALLRDVPEARQGRLRELLELLRERRESARLGDERS